MQNLNHLIHHHNSLKHFSQEKKNNALQTLSFGMTSYSGCLRPRKKNYTSGQIIVHMHIDLNLPGISF
jgi:hypothetical protein